MIPPLVLRAGAAGLTVGPLLHVLAAQRGRARVAVVGAPEAAWVASALPPGVPLFVVDPDPSSRELFAADPNVHVFEGDTASLEAEAPFDLLVVRGAADADAVVRLLMPGGTVVAQGRPLSHPRVACVSLGAATVGVLAL